jgi:hypothetical protein
LGEQVEGFRAERGFWDGFDGEAKSRESGQGGVLGLSEKWIKDVKEPLGSVAKAKL